MLFPVRNEGAILHRMKILQVLRNKFLWGYDKERSTSHLFVLFLKFVAQCVRTYEEVTLSDKT